MPKIRVSWTTKVDEGYIAELELTEEQIKKLQADELELLEKLPDLEEESHRVRADVTDRDIDTWRELEPKKNLEPAPIVTLEQLHSELEQLKARSDLALGGPLSMTSSLIRHFQAQLELAMRHAERELNQYRGKN